MALYGHEIQTRRAQRAGEADLARLVKFEKGEFIGPPPPDALLKQTGKGNHTQS